MLFLQLLNRVLAKNGRRPLPPRSPQWSTVQVSDSDRVLPILAGSGAGKTEVLVWRVLYELFVIGTDVLPAGSGSIVRST